MTRITKVILTSVVSLAAVFFLIMGIIYFFPKSPQNAGGARRSFLFFPIDQGRGTPLITNESTSSNPVAINPAEFKLFQLTQGPVVGATLSKDETRVIFYRQAGGNVESLDLNGQNEEELSPLTIVGITDVNWSPNKDEAIVSYLEGDTLKHFLHVIATSSTSFLPAGITSVDWSPDGKSIAYTSQSQQGLRVNTAAPDGKNAKSIFLSPIPDWRVSWIDSLNVFLTTRSSYASQGLAKALSLTKKLTDVISLPGLGALSAPLKGLFLITSTNNAGALQPLEIIKRGSGVVVTSDAKTLAEKCAWAKDASTLYCGVPGNSGGQLPDDWYQGKILFQDRIVKIDPATGVSQELLPPSLFDVTAIFTDSHSRFLFFIDKKDGSLWRLQLGSTTPQ
jgi:hypothetical protein